MCLGIPGRVVGLADGYAGQVALVDVEGAERQVNIGMLEAQPAAGDWVLIHMGFAVEVIDEAAARDRAGRPGADGQRPRRPGSAAATTCSGSCRASASGRSSTSPPRSSGWPARCRTPRPGSSSRSRATPTPSTRSAAGWSSDAPPLAEVEGVHETELPTRGGTGFTIEDSSDRRRAHARLARRRGLRRLPGRARRPARPALPAPVHHLHELRPALHDHHRAALRPGRHHDGRLRDVRRLPRGVRRPRRPALPRAADRLPRLRSDARAGRRRPAQRPARDRRRRRTTGAGAARRRRRSSRSRGSAATTWPATPATRQAVAELRRRKQRGGKPFAVMVRDLDVAETLVRIDRGGAAPAHRHPQTRGPPPRLPRSELSGAHAALTTPPPDNSVAEAVAPGNPDLGVLLPYTPAARAAARARRATRAPTCW